MATESEVMIGSTWLGGTAKRVGDHQAQLFNASDLTAVGDIGTPEFLRAYQITVRELRRRLEALGYSLDHVREEIVTTLRKGYDELGEDDPVQCKAFLNYGCAITTDQLIELVKLWKCRGRSNYDLMDQFNLDDFTSIMLEFIQGCSSEWIFPAQNIWLVGYHFERLLCEIHSEDELFSIDFTRLIEAGYYKPDAQPISNNFDRTLSQFLH